MSEQIPPFLKTRKSEILMLKMYEDGYLFIGGSSFNAVKAPMEDLVAHAKSLKACLVLFDSKYSHTASGVVPITQYHPGETYHVKTNGTITANSNTYSYNQYSKVKGPSTVSTEYIPYENRRYDVLALFFIKLKNPKYLGLFLGESPLELRKKLDQNPAYVKAVRKGGPADRANIVAGDAIISVNGVKCVYSNDNFSCQKIVEENHGKEVTLAVYRDGVTLEKRVTVGNP